MDAPAPLHLEPLELAIVDAVAAFLCGKLGAEQSWLRARLLERLGRGDPPALRPLYRVEYAVKGPPDPSMEILVHVALKTTTGLATTTLGLTALWEHLPDEIRAELIRAPHSCPTYVLLPQGLP